MKKFSKSIALVLSVLAVSAIVSCAVLAWTEPGSPAPAGNVAAPINTGGATQTKNGSLNISGSIGIGTTSPSQKLDVAGTALIDYLRIDPQDGINEGGELQLAGSGSYGTFQIDNYQGNARIHTLSSGKQFQILGGTIHVNGTGGNNYFAGNVGIGTASPSQKLDVVGYVKGQTGLCINNDCRTAWPQEKTCPAGQAITGFNKTTGAFTCGNSCTPSCAGKACGSDGCGGSCGTCASGLVCNASGQCVSSCTPSCAGKACGSDGCGGSCGTCPSGYSCNSSYQCVFDPSKYPCSGSSLPAAGSIKNKRIFVTSSVYNADTFVTKWYSTTARTPTVSSESLADEKCQALADAAGFKDGTFKAMTYMGTRDINTIVPGGSVFWSCNSTSGWKTVATGLSDFFSVDGSGNSIGSPIYNEFGISSSDTVWTGFEANGSGYKLLSSLGYKSNGWWGGCANGCGWYQDCSGYICYTGAVAWYGSPNVTTPGWAHSGSFDGTASDCCYTARNWKNCAAVYRALYCIEQ